MIKGIHHVSMKCNTEEEISKVKEFYISVMGMKIIREWSDGFMIDTGNGYIEIFTNADGEHRLGSIRHFALLTDDVDSIAEKVKDAGYELFVEPNDKVIRSVPEAMYNVANLLLSKDKEKNKDEALSWLRRSANAGYDAAYDMLSDMEDE